MKKDNETIKKLNSELKQLSDAYSHLPKENLLIVHDKAYTKFYVSDGHTRKYLSKKNQKFITKLAYKKYIELKLAVIKQNLFLLTRKLPQIEFAEQQLYKFLCDPAISPLLASYCMTDSTARAWMMAPFESNPNHLEHLIHKAPFGIMVRSKSEAMIAIALTKRQIPFRYECKLVLGDITLYPDFTIMLITTKKVKYYEHFGMMDNPKYAEEAYKKLKLYTDNGILPMEDLLISFETSTQPLSFEKINQILDTLLE